MNDYEPAFSEILISRKPLNRIANSATVDAPACNAFIIQKIPSELPPPLPMAVSKLKISAIVSPTKQRLAATSQIAHRLGPNVDQMNGQASKQL